jgi:hypothetical protein
MKKNLVIKIFACFLLLSLLVSQGVSVRAQSIDRSTILDTTSLTQQEYLEVLNVSARQQSESALIENSDLIKLTCETFLTLAKASVRNPLAYDPSQLIVYQSRSLDTIKYRLSEYEYLAKLYQTLKQVISDDSLEFTDFVLLSKEKTVTAGIVETYKYTINDGFDGENFRRRMYYFDLQFIDGQWQITNVTTNDPWEQSEAFVYQPIDVESAINELSADNLPVEPSLDSETKKITGSSSVSSLYTWAYTVSDAVSYAEEHYDDTSNPVFGFTDGNDCQNFASQCVWAGLGGSGTNPTARPAVSTGLVGGNAFNVWARNQCTTYYQEYYFNWAWDNVDGFMKLMTASTTSAEGPYGNSYYTNAISSAEAGNVLSVNWYGTASEGSMSHAMFITAVTGTAGSRTKDNIKIAAHTSATNSAYQVLSSYTSAPIANFGRSVIWRGYYATQQPLFFTFLNAIYKGTNKLKFYSKPNGLTTQSIDESSR